MRKLVGIFAVALLAVGCGGNAKKVQEVNYETYVNVYYDYAVDYPDFLIPQGEADNGDGQRFISEDGNSTFYAYHDKKMDTETGDLPAIGKAFEESSQGKNVTDQQLYENYYTISGKLENNSLFTQYTIFEAGSYWTLWFEYPESDADLFETIITHVIGSFNLGVNEGMGAGGAEDMFPAFLQQFLDDCWWNKNLNSLLRDADPTLANYIDPNMDVRRYYAPGSISYLASRADNFGFAEYDDFTTTPVAGGEYTMEVLPEGLSYCELENSQAIYYQLVPSVPDELVNPETFEFAPVQIPYTDAPIMCAYLVPIDGRSPLALYFVYTPNGWKLAFVDDTLCSA